MKKIIRFSFSEKEEDGSILVEAELPEELERSNEMVSQIMQAAYKTELDVDAASEDMTEAQTNRVRSALESIGVKFTILDPYVIWL